MSTSRKQTNQVTTLLFGMLAMILVVSIIWFPGESFEASLQGLHIWWKIVFPALLPFLILTEIALAYGFFHFLGVCLEPAMRSLFRLPGISGPVMAIGFAAGFPASAKLTCRLREQNLLQQKEGEMLLALSHMASPILIINVIAVSFFHNAKLGWFLLLVQWVSLILVGTILRWVIAISSFVPFQHKKTSYSLMKTIHQAFQAMMENRQQDGRAFGKILGDAVTESIQTLMMIGGYMMIFSVFIRMISVSPLFNLLYAPMKTLIPDSLVMPIVSLLMEIHLGSHAWSTLLSTHISWQIAVIGFFLAFSSFSSHAQVIHFTHRTDLRYLPFFSIKCLHGVVTMILTLIVWKWVHPYLQQAELGVMSFGSIIQERVTWNIVDAWGSSLSMLLMIIGIWIVISIAILCMRRWFRSF